MKKYTENNSKYSKDIRKKCSAFASDDVWDKILELEQNLNSPLFLDYINDDNICFCDPCAAFRIFPIGKVDGKWELGTSIDIFDIKTDIAANDELNLLNELVLILNAVSF